MAELPTLRPLNFREILTFDPGKAAFDWIPILDLGIILGAILLLGQPFFQAPGVTITLPTTTQPGPTGIRPAAVLTAGRNNLLFFDGRKLAPAQLPERLLAFQSRPGHAGGTLLIKADASLDLRELLALIDAARAAGFAEVHLAAEAPPAEADGLTSPAPNLLPTSRP